MCCKRQSVRLRNDKDSDMEISKLFEITRTSQIDQQNFACKERVEFRTRIVKAVEMDIRLNTYSTRHCNGTHHCPLQNDYSTLQIAFPKTSCVVGLWMIIIVRSSFIVRHDSRKDFEKKDKCLVGTTIIPFLVLIPM